MFTYAKLVFKSYMPKTLEKGMWFASKQKDVVYGKIYDYLLLHELAHIPQDMTSYIASNGAPVEPYIVQPMTNADAPEQILATPEKIGWWDEGDDTENLEDLTIKIINDNIYGENGQNGAIALETYIDDDNEEQILLFHGKVTIRHCELIDENSQEEEEEEFDDDEYYDIGGSE